MIHHPANRSGISLIQFLVIVAVVGMLLAFFMLGVRRAQEEAIQAREAARAEAERARAQAEQARIAEQRAREAEQKAREQAEKALKEAQQRLEELRQKELRGLLPLEKSAKPVKLFEVPHYCEGIVFDHAGFAYISHGKVITKFSPNGKHGTWAETGAPNGHKVLADGTHLVCDASHHGVLHLDANGKILGKASSQCDGKPLRGPNDLTLDQKNGGFYFTDPGGSDIKKPIGTVHYVDPQGKTHLVASGFAYPNGIALRPDGKTLLMAESQKNRILAFEVLSPGKVGPMTVFANLPAKEGEQIDNQPDGICLDEAGNLYVAHYGMKQVQVLDLEGKLIRRYPGGNLTTSNVGFSGANMDQLYITGGLGKEAGPGGLFRLDLPGVRGLTILPKKSGM